MGQMTVKVYLVLQRINLVRADRDPNVRVLDAFLTRSAAQDLVDRVPGTWVVKLYAKK